MQTLVLAGPSGTGKSNLAIQFAESWQQKNPGRPVEILCADSITVYRGCDIGSAKPSAADRARVPHHLLDLRDPDQEFTAADFVRDADPILQRLHAAQGLAILVGGTGFYLRALLQGMAEQDEAASAKSENVKEKLLMRADSEGMSALYQEMLERDPDLTGKIHQNDHYRIVRALQAMELTNERWSVLNKNAKEREPRYKDVRFFCLELPKPILQERLLARTHAMLEAGFVGEVKTLLARYPANAKALQSVGYRECLEFLGLIPPITPPSPQTERELCERITQSTLRLAKRQLTWFRGERGVEWLSCERSADFLPTLEQRLLLK